MLFVRGRFEGENVFLLLASLIDVTAPFQLHEVQLCKQVCFLFHPLGSRGRTNS